MVDAVMAPSSVSRAAEAAPASTEPLVRVRGLKVTSPVSPVATYSLLDAYRIVVAHERKHFEQARRVTQAEGFPKS